MSFSFSEPLIPGARSTIVCYRHSGRWLDTAARTRFHALEVARGIPRRFNFGNAVLCGKMFARADAAFECTVAGRGSARPLVFGKSVDASRELRITIDTGTWPHRFHARFEIRGEQSEGHYQQIDREHIDRLCMNLAVAVREMEAEVYPPVAQARERINAS